MFQRSGIFRTSLNAKMTTFIYLNALLALGQVLFLSILMPMQRHLVISLKD
jgi:hypothetical protein